MHTPSAASIATMFPPALPDWTPGNLTAQGKTWSRLRALKVVPDHIARNALAALREIGRLRGLADDDEALTAAAEALDNHWAIPHDTYWSCACGQKTEGTDDAAQLVIERHIAQVGIRAAIDSYNN